MEIKHTNKFYSEMSGKDKTGPLRALKLFHADVRVGVSRGYTDHHQGRGHP